MKKVFSKKNFFLLGAIFILVLFAYITCKTPLAGDDWGYALNGSLGTPIKTTLEFYNSWSGRFFSELWGMIVPCNRWIWNIVNPLLFVGIFIFIYKLGSVDKKYVLCCLFILAFMLSVDDNLRMETYTWIMGTTYVIPLCFSLGYFVIVEKLILNDSYDKKVKYLNYFSNILLFVIGLMMENIAAAMIVAIVIILIYSFFNKKDAIKYLLLNLVFSVTSFTIMRLSPGSASRLVNDNAKWAAMSLFEKLGNGYPNFLSMSFINNNYAVTLFSIILIVLVLFSKKKNNITTKTINLIVSLLGIFNVFSFVIFKESSFNNPSSIYSMVFWPIYVINAFSIILLYTENDYRKLKALFFLVVGGSSALAMLYSPIYGSRSAIYLVYYLIVVSMVLLEDIHFDKKWMCLVLCLVMLVIIDDRTIEFITKYRLVGIRQQERLEVIKYYQEHPEDEEAWIPRFPIYSIHGADIEPGDTYHFETFKEFYNLPQDADKIFFYFVEDN